MEFKRKIIVILGSTASGKSALAIRISKKLRARLFRLIPDKFIKT